MRLHLRLIAVMVVALGLVGGVLALTVLDTNENANHPASNTGPAASESGSGATGENVGATGEYAQALPLPIDGPLLGVNLTAYTKDGYGQPAVRADMRTLADLGSTAVTLVPTWYMKSANSNRIAPDSAKTPSDASLIAAMEMAHEAGLEVVVKPHVDVIDDTYRGAIDPRNREAWFRSYEGFIGHFADLAADRSAELFVVGTELKTLSGATDRWRRLIRDLRDRFPGPVTYAANWDEVDQVQFWDELDAIGVDAYYPLSETIGSAPGLEGLTNAWRQIADRLKAASRRWDRPVILTEVGYPSQVGATVNPYAVTGQPADQEIQALAYRAVFRALSGAEWLEGISWWSWRADLSQEESPAIDYSPEGKRAQGELARGQFAFQG